MSSSPPQIQSVEEIKIAKVNQSERLQKKQMSSYGLNLEIILKLYILDIHDYKLKCHLQHWSIFLLAG